MPIEKLLPLGLAFIMFAIGLTLQVEDFRRVIRHPLAMAAGLANQMLILPLLGIGAALLWSGRPDFALGIVLLAACPGGITSNLLTWLAGGRVALSVSMTAVTSLASLVTVPLVLDLGQRILAGEEGGHGAITMPLEQIMGGIFIVTALPMILGMSLRRLAPAVAERLQGWARPASVLIFATLVGFTFFSHRLVLAENFSVLGPILLLLNLATMALGYGTAAALHRPDAEAIAISLECGLQNVALALFIALSVLDRPEMSVPAILYAVLMNVSAATFIAWRRRSKALVEAGSGSEL